jgi:hypothetical protein
MRERGLGEDYHQHYHQCLVMNKRLGYPSSAVRGVYLGVCLTDFAKLSSEMMMAGLRGR